MANASLGIYIDDGLIKYAKLQREKDNVKIEAFNVVFYDNLERELNKIIAETGSSKIPICVNLSNEMYNYFEVISLIQKKDRAQSIKIDFETLCDEKGLQVNDLEARYLLKESDTNSDKLTAIHVSVEKNEVSKLANSFSSINKKISSLRPITTSIINLLEISEKENVVIVNLEKETKVTTIINGMISRIDTLTVGMKDILSAINETENSIRKSYEVCKNTTIYTQGTEVMDSDENEYLEEIMPVLYNIVQQTKEIVEDCSSTIHKIYITGLGSVINNIDLYFQEYALNSKCEILKPFFLENTSLNTSFKDYIEVNSAIALALDELGFCAVGDDFNFKKGSASFDPKALLANKSLNPEINFDMKGPLDATEKVLLRISAVLGIAIVLYILFSGAILNKIEDMKIDTESKISSVTREITKAETDIKIIQNQADHYAQIAEVLKNLVEENEEILNSVPEIMQGAIPNMLNAISNLIPKDVMLLSLKNTEGTHIVIETVSPDYEQIGFFKALLSTKNILTNVKSSSGQKVSGYAEEATGSDEEWIYVTIEGDLQ